MNEKALKIFSGITDIGDAVGCGAVIGKLINGSYYYRNGTEFWRYTVGEEPELLFSERTADYVFADEGVYYTKNLSEFYFQPYDGGETVMLYKPDDEEIDQVRFELQPNGTVVLKIYDLEDSSNNLKSAQSASSLLIDGSTGEVLEVLYENIPFMDSLKLADYRWQEFKVGDRTFNCVQSEAFDSWYDILEDGKSILPEGAAVDGRIFEFGAGVVVTVYDAPGSSGAHWQLYLLPDGRELNIGSTIYHAPLDDTGRYLLYSHHEGKIAVYDTETGERWSLKTDSDIKISDAVTDGTYLYSVYYGDTLHSVWQINCDEDGKPIGLTLLTEDICG